MYVVSSNRQETYTQNKSPVESTRLCLFGRKESPLQNLSPRHFPEPATLCSAFFTPNCLETSFHFSCISILVPDTALPTSSIRDGLHFSFGILDVDTESFCVACSSRRTVQDLFLLLQPLRCRVEVWWNDFVYSFAPTHPWLTTLSHCPKEMNDSKASASLWLPFSVRPPHQTFSAFSDS